MIGEGLLALMLPGGPGFGRGYMRGTAELFADLLRSHLIVPHGSGGSTPPADPADYSPEGHARFYEEAREALGLGRLVVFGHSFGATTALTYAALYPEAMVERHRDAPWYPEAKAAWDSWTERVLATEDPGEVERMMAVVLPLYVAHPERPEVAAALEGFKKDLKADLAADKAWEGGLYQEIDLRPVLARVRAPTLVVAGELDPICGPAQSRPISEASRRRPRFEPARRWSGLPEARRACTSGALRHEGFVRHARNLAKPLTPRALCRTTEPDTRRKSYANLGGILLAASSGSSLRSLPASSGLI